MKDKKVFLAFIGFICVIFCVSRGRSREKADTRFLYNGRAEGQVCSGGGYLFDQTKNPLKMVRLNDGAEYEFIRDPFLEEEKDFSPIRKIFSGENFLYYISDAGEGLFQIVQRDYETFSEKIIYSKEYWRLPKEIFLGIAKSEPYINRDFIYDSLPRDFCVFKDTLFLFYYNRVECMDRKSKKISLLCEKGVEAGNYSYYQGKLFFIGEDFSLYSYDIGKDKLEAFEGMKARRFLVTPKGIFYANANDGWKLYFMDFNGEEKRKLTDTAVTSMDFSGECLYYLSGSESERHVCSMDLDGCNEEILFDLPRAFFLSCANGKQMLYITYTSPEGRFAIYPYEISSDNR